MESDLLSIIDDIYKINFIKFNTYRRVRENCKPQMTIYFCDCKLYDSFFSLYFKDKSISSPDKLINILPTEFVRYFFLGLIDGDGSFYISKDTKTKQFSITSTYEQDWTHIENLFYSINIGKFDIQRKVSNVNSKSSTIRISNYSDNLKLYNYLYPNGYEFGLKRKYEKCKEIIDNKPKYTCNNEYIGKDNLLNVINSLETIDEICKHFKCSKKKILNHINKYEITDSRFIQEKKLRKDEYMSIEESKEYMSSFNLKSKNDWVIFCKNGQRPKNIPSNPYQFYKRNGWISYGDWLGF
jgi:hypothetical protein